MGLLVGRSCPILVGEGTPAAAHSPALLATGVCMSRPSSGGCGGGGGEDFGGGFRTVGSAVCVGRTTLGGLVLSMSFLSMKT